MLSFPEKGISFFLFYFFFACVCVGCMLGLELGWLGRGFIYEFWPGVKLSARKALNGAVLFF